MTNEKKKAPNVFEHVEGENRNPNTHQDIGATMPNSIPNTADNFSAAFNITTGNARISVESHRDYWQNNTLPNLVRLTDDSESHLLLSPAEALSVAAALHSVALYLMEQRPREITRRTEPGAPTFEEGI